MGILRSAASIDDSILAMTFDWAERRSKDPSTKVGACIYDPRTGGMFFGYNGFPSKLEDDEGVWNNRDLSDGLTKYDFVIHAEKNALTKALISGASVSECVLYCTHIPCPRCIVEVVAAHLIKRVVFRIPTFNSLTLRDRNIIDHISRKCNISMEMK